MAVTCQKRVAHFARNTREFYPKIYQIGGGSLSPEWVAHFHRNKKPVTTAVWAGSFLNVSMADGKVRRYSSRDSHSTI